MSRQNTCASLLCSDLGPVSLRLRELIVRKSGRGLDHLLRRIGNRVSAIIPTGPEVQKKRKTSEVARSVRRWRRGESRHKQ